MTGKTFKDKTNITSPAKIFISNSVEPSQVQPPQDGKIPAGYKLVPIEKKTQRVQLVMRPSLVQEAKEYCKANGTSFNELCSIAIEEYLNK